MAYDYFCIFLMHFKKWENGQDNVSFENVKKIQECQDG